MMRHSSAQVANTRRVAVTTTLAAGLMYLLSTTTPAAFAFQNTNTGVVLLPAVVWRNQPPTTFSSGSSPSPSPSSLLRLRMSSTVLEAPSTKSTTARTILQPVRPQKKTEGIVHEDENEENIVVLQNEPPSLSTIRKTMLPKAVFDIDTKTSLFYFAVDLLAVVTSMGLLKTVVTSSVFQASPLLVQILLAAPLQTLTGFAMWCMWCIGHDAGHGTVSKTKWINRVVGEIAHSVISVTPFVPWQKSHRRHHMHHNHIEKDYSHQWFIREEAEDLHPLIKLSYKTRNLQLPILYFVYLVLGVPDGGHFFLYGRMWDAELRSQVRAAMVDASKSVAVSLATIATAWQFLAGGNLFQFGMVCVIPWCVLSFWLFMVTYLQHHSDDGKLYTDDTYTFERGAFETVDRNYGTAVNQMSHHMMDGHVAHHLFYQKIPHYHLAQATTALRAGLADTQQSHLYKLIETPDFTQEIIKQFNKNWFFINEAQVVRTWNPFTTISNHDKDADSTTETATIKTTSAATSTTATEAIPFIQ